MVAERANDLDPGYQVVQRFETVLSTANLGTDVIVAGATPISGLFEVPDER